MYNSENGLVFQGIFSDGNNPLDSIEWVKHDVVIKNGDKVVFAQKGVEFPDFWGETAINIVTSKYFRGNLGTPERERSLKDVIERIVRVYVATGKQKGYFKDEKSADNFGNELRYLIVHQMFSFNSPVWFNVGTASKPQTSACFLLDVEDSMEDILQWYKEEGMIFKGGSGAGINLSKLRGSKERLSSGGVASGPISFMRGADSSAGAIKSGGATRRAAKMVALDIDHPDIEDFIDLKASEERKIRALAAAGFDMGLNGKDITSVQYQNANNSVMVSDNFMNAVEHDKEWDLINRTDGSVAKTVKARKLWRQIAQRAWECADPGIQFSDTMNEWHTLVPFGPIVTSNPCLRGDTVCPTREGLITIAEWATSGETRHVWDGSEWVRANATLTGVKSTVEVKLSTNRSLFMTSDHKVISCGEAVEVSNAVGRPIDVLRPRHDLGEIIPPLVVDGMLHGDGTYHKATGQWYLTIGAKDSDMRTYAKENGSVIRHREYPGGKECLWLTPTVDLEATIIPNRMIPDKVYRGTPDQIRSFLRGLFSANGNVVVTHKRVNLKSTNREMLHQVMDMLALLGIRSSIVTNRAASITHSNGVYESRESYSVVINGVADVRMFAETIGMVHAYKVERLNAISALSGTPRDIRIVDLVPTGRNESVYDFHMEKTHHGCISGFDIHNCGEYLSIPNSACNLGSLNLLKFVEEPDGFDYLGFSDAVRVAITAMDISIEFSHFPTEKIGRNSRKFRQLGIGYANLGALLMSFGLAYDSDEGREVAAGITSVMTSVAYDQSVLMAKAVGAYEGYVVANEWHNKVLQSHADMAFENGFIESYERFTSAQNGPLRNAQVSVLAPTGTIGLQMGCITTGIEPEYDNVKYKTQVDGSITKFVNPIIDNALESLGYVGSLAEKLKNVILGGGDPGRLVAAGMSADDVAVFATAAGKNPIPPLGHIKMMAAVQPFLTGAISKTVNLPSSATVDDIEELHLEAWRLGLKSIAIYRDGSKNTQVLTSDVKEEEEKAPKVIVNEAKDVHNGTRYKLPKRRPGLTTSFQVGGSEGYLTSSVYENGKLGEIFLKMSKQGSTMAGMMDAFSIAISLGLQYGVPLEVFARKFLNMTFSPAGITSDPELRMTSSVLDYVFRRLMLDYSDQEKLEELGIKSTVERAKEVNGIAETQRPEPKVTLALDDVPLCSSCGSQTRSAGSCRVCETCGETSGCS